MIYIYIYIYRLILEELNKGYKLRLLSSCFTLFKEGCLKSHETKLQNEIKAAKLGELHSKKTMKHYFKGWKEIPIAIQKKKENKIKAIKFWYSMIISKSFNIMKFKYQRKRYIKDLEGDILPFRTYAYIYIHTYIYIYTHTYILYIHIYI